MTWQKKKTFKLDFCLLICLLWYLLWHHLWRPTKSKKLTSMLHVTHLWQVTNELANPFGQSAYTLDQKLQTQGAFLLCWFISLHSKDVSINEYLCEAKFLINQMASEFIRNFYSHRIQVSSAQQNSDSKKVSKVTKDVSSLPSISFYCIPFLIRIIRKADGSGIVQKFRSEFYSLYKAAWFV